MTIQSAKLHEQILAEHTGKELNIRTTHYLSNLFILPPEEHLFAEVDKMEKEQNQREKWLFTL